MSSTASDLADNNRYLWVCAYVCSHVLSYFFPQCVPLSLSPSPCESVCECVYAMLIRFGPGPINVKRTVSSRRCGGEYRTVLSAHSQQQFSHASNSCTFTHAHMDTDVVINQSACGFVKKPEKRKSTQARINTVRCYLEEDKINKPLQSCAISKQNPWFLR